MHVKEKDTLIEQLSALGYEVSCEKENKSDLLTLHQNDNSYDLQIIDETDLDYFKIPVDTNISSNDTLNTTASFVGFIHNSSDSRNLYIFKKDEVSEYSQKIRQKLHEESRYGFSDMTRDDTKRIHVYFDKEDNDLYTSYLHLPVAFLAQKLNNKVKILDNKEKSKISAI